MTTKFSNINTRATTEWRDALNDLAFRLRLSQSTAVEEGVRLLAELHGIKMPPRTPNPEVNLHLRPSLDFSTLDFSKFQKAATPVQMNVLREILERAGISKWSGSRDSNYGSSRVDICFLLGELQFALRAASQHIELVRLEGFDELLIAEADATDPDCVHSLVDAIERRNTR